MPNSKTFAERVLKGAAAEQETEIREAVGKERQYTEQAAGLELRAKDGLQHEALSWVLFERFRWRGGAEETLVLIFGSAVVFVGGQNLQRLTEMIRERRLEIIQEHDQAEAMLLEAQNRPLAPQLRKAIVTKLSVEPEFDDAVEEIRG